MKPESNVMEAGKVTAGVKSNKFTKFRITIEPFGFLFVTAIAIQPIVTQNLYLFKVCTGNLGLDINVCNVDNQTDSRNNNTARLIIRIQSYVSTLNIYATLIEHIPSVFFVLFLGPFSNQYGRKILMVAPLIGHVLATLIRIANYYAVTLPAEYILLSDIPLGLFGGMITFSMAVNNYMVDITSEETRTFRLSIVAGITGLAMPIAQFISVPIYKNGGYLAIWLTALSLQTVALIYLIFFVTDSRGKWARKHSDDESIVEKIVTVKEKEHETKSHGCTTVFKNLWKCFVITFQRREGFKRASISFLLACISLIFFSVMGTHGMAYLYTRKKFGWNQPDYALYVAIFSSIQVFGTLILVPILTSYFKLPDIVIGLISLIGNIFSFLLIAFATSSLMIYISAIGHLFAMGIMVVIRSMLSKIVKHDELSYVYSVMACLESIVPLLSSPILNTVYKATLDIFPGTVFLVEAGIDLIVMAFIIAVMILQKKDQALNSVRPTSNYYSPSPEKKQ